ncbi:hypothetical protein JOM56_014381 [Amanita muscaria]
MNSAYQVLIAGQVPWSLLILPSAAAGLPPPSTTTAPLARPPVEAPRYRNAIPYRVTQYPSRMLLLCKPDMMNLIQLSILMPLDEDFPRLRPRRVRHSPSVLSTDFMNSSYETGIFVMGAEIRCNQSYDYSSPSLKLGTKPLPLSNPVQKHPSPPRLLMPDDPPTINAPMEIPDGSVSGPSLQPHPSAVLAWATSRVRPPILSHTHTHTHTYIYIYIYIYPLHAILLRQRTPWIDPWSSGRSIIVATAATEAIRAISSNRLRT